MATKTDVAGAFLIGVLGGLHFAPHIQSYQLYRHHLYNETRHYDVAAARDQGYDAGYDYSDDASSSRNPAKQGGGNGDR